MRLKHIVVLLGTAAGLSMLSLSNLHAQSGEEYLKQIAENTYNTLQRVDKLPAFLEAATKAALAWTEPMKAENSPPLQTLQTSMTQLGDLLAQGQAKQFGMMQTLNNDLLNNDGKNVFNTNAGKSNTGTAPSSTNLWYANDLVYSSVLGMPYFNKDPRNQPGQPPSVNPAYNYIKNAGGLNIYHKLPSPSWKEGPAKTRYQNYYNTVMAVESYNSFVLSNQVADGNQLNTLQATLVSQATDPQAWIAQVASEQIGFVLRQILLYQSQAFVMLTQLVQTQKQMVTAQAMTNATLIAINQLNENTMVANAEGVQPS